jgi:aldehyde:ferredoxin oxidoreductase
MFYGWTGVNLEIDLSSGNIERTEGDRKLYEQYLGGKGTNARLFWDRVTPEVAPFSPDNPIIIGNGVLTGTPVPSSNRAVFTYRSPLTKLHQYSALGGLWPTELKHAGYDTTVISGESPTPVYIWIHDDAVEIRDASHVWGKSTYETKRILREELQSNDVQVISIGLAGERKVIGATVEDGIGSSVSRGGIGALMGKKNLKAIAVRGTKDIYIAKPERLNELCEYILGRAGQYRGWTKQLAYQLNASNVNVGFFGNLTETYDEADYDFQEIIDYAAEECQDLIDKERVREVSCYNCGIRCKNAFRRPDGGYSFIKCQSWWAFIVSSKMVDYDFSLKCYLLCEKYGLDSVSVARYVAFATDLYERGILKKEDTDGMALEWANKDVVFSLIEKIARREGIGDVLADGVYEAARQIGKGAEDHAHHTKKMEYMPSASYFLTPAGALLQAISDKADPSRNATIFQTAIWQAPKDIREDYVDSEYCLHPEKYREYLLSEFDETGEDYEPACQIASYDQELFCITDLTGLCNFWTGFMPYPPINTRSLKAELISCVTGMDIDETGLTRIARRVTNLVRSCNVRLGLTRKDDTISKVFFKGGGGTELEREKIDPERFSKLIDRFYDINGWNSDGVPTRETLDELDLGFVSEDSQQRGIV